MLSVYVVQASGGLFGASFSHASYVNVHVSPRYTDPVPISVSTRQYTVLSLHFRSAGTANTFFHSPVSVPVGVVIASSSAEELAM